MATFTCPNKNFPEWKSLVNTVGLKEAMRDYLEYDGVIRTPVEVLAKITDVTPYTTRFYTGISDEDIRSENKEAINKEITQTSMVELFKHLDKKFGIKGEIINDPAKKWKGALVGEKTPTVNMAYANLSDGFHEYSHAFLMSLRLHNKELFLRLYNDLSSTKEWKEISERAHKRIREKYGEKNLEDAIEEVLATALGWAAEKQYNTLSEKFKRIIAAILSWVKTVFNVTNNLPLSTASMNVSTSLSEVVDLFVDPNVRFDLADYQNLPYTNKSIEASLANTPEFLQGLKSGNTIAQKLDQTLKDRVDLAMGNSSVANEMLDENDLLKDLKNIKIELDTETQTKAFEEYGEVTERAIEQGKKAPEFGNWFEKFIEKGSFSVFSTDLTTKIQDHNEKVAKTDLPIDIKKLLHVSTKKYKPRVSKKSKEGQNIGTILGPIPDNLREYNNTVVTEVLNGAVFYIRRYLNGQKAPADNIDSFSHRIGNIEEGRDSSSSETGLGRAKFIEDTGGKKFPLTTKFLEYLRANPQGKTNLTKAFSMSGTSVWEKDVLKEFYDIYYTQIVDDFASKGRKPPKSIDNSRLADKYLAYITEKYPISFYETDRPNTYNNPGTALFDRSITSVGYEVAISNGFLAQSNYSVHTYDLKNRDSEGNLVPAPISFYRDQNKKSDSSIENAAATLGWYIYHVFDGDIPIIYEFQSDFIDVADYDEETGTYDLDDLMDMFVDIEQLEALQEEGGVMTPDQLTKREKKIEKILTKLADYLGRANGESGYTLKTIEDVLNHPAYDNKTGAFVQIPPIDHAVKSLGIMTKDDLRKQITSQISSIVTGIINRMLSMRGLQLLGDTTSENEKRRANFFMIEKDRVVNDPAYSLTPKQKAAVAYAIVPMLGGRSVKEQRLIDKINNEGVTKIQLKAYTRRLEEARANRIKFTPESFEKRVLKYLNPLQRAHFVRIYGDITEITPAIASDYLDAVNKAAKHPQRLGRNEVIDRFKNPRSLTDYHYRMDNKIQKALARARKLDRTKKNIDSIVEADSTLIAKVKELQAERIKAVVKPIIDEWLELVPEIDIERLAFNYQDNLVTLTQKALDRLDIQKDQLMPIDNVKIEKTRLMLGELDKAKIIVQELLRLKQNQLKLFITHSILYAKSQGKTKVYFPTAELISLVESGDPWTLYVTPEERKTIDKYADAHVGSFYEALMKIPGLEYKRVKPPKLKAHVLEVDISNLALNGLTRFSKLDEPEDTSSMSSQEYMEHIRQKAKREQVGVLGASTEMYDYVKGDARSYSLNGTVITVIPGLPNKKGIVNIKDKKQALAVAKRMATKLNTAKNKAGALIFSDIKSISVATATTTPEGRVIIKLSPSRKTIEKHMMQSTDPDDLSFYRELADTVEASVTNQDTDNARVILSQFAQQLNVPYEFITEKQAADISPKWNNERGFFHEGIVYFVGDILTTAMVLHEFAHPLVRQILHSNPKLFNNLFNGIINTPEGVILRDQVLKTYPELEENSDRFKEEIIVFALQYASQLKLQKKEESSGFKKAISNILYAIKQWFRQKFGIKIKIENLKTDTSIQKLADILTEGGRFDIKLGDVSDTEIAFQKELRSLAEQEVDRKNRIKRIESAIKVGKKNPEDLITLINDLSKVNKRFLNDIDSNEEYQSLLQAIIDSAQGNELENVKRSIKNFTVDPNNPQEWKAKLEAMKASVEEVAEHSEALTNNLERLLDTFISMKKHMEELAASPNNKDNLHKMIYYGQFMEYWLNYFNHPQDKNPNSVVKILKKNGIDTDNPLFVMISTITATIDGAIGKDSPLAKVKFEAAYSTGVKLLEPMATWIDKYYGDMVANLEKVGAKKEANRVRVEWDLQITPLKDFRTTLAGGWFGGGRMNNMMEGYLYNQDPVVMMLAKYVEDNVIDVQVSSHRKSNDFLKKVFPVLKKAGYNPTRLGKLGEDMGFLDRIFDVDPDGKEKPKLIWRILNPFHDTRYHVNKMRNAIWEAQEKAEKSKKQSDYDYLDRLTIELQEHQAKYFHRRYTPEFYKRFDLFKDDIGKEAQHRLRAWQRKMQLFNDTHDPLSTEEDEVQEARQKALEKEYRQMFSEFDGDVKKIDDPEANVYELAITKRLLEYRKASSQFYKDIERPDVFKAKYLEYRQKILTRLSIMSPPKGEGSAEYQILMDQWKNRNVQKKTTTAYQNMLKNTYDRIAQLTAKSKTASQEAILRAEISDISAKHRDDVGIVNAQNISPGLMARVKKNEEELALLRKDKSKYQGTLSDKEKEELFLAFDFLDDMRVRKATMYYADNVNEFLKTYSDSTRAYFNKYMGAFEITEDNADELFTAGEREGDVLNLLLRENDNFKEWFLKNHIIKSQYNEDIKKSKKVWIRLAPWNVALPRADKYYQKTVIKDENGKTIDTVEGIPARKYFDRVVKGDPKGKTAEERGYFTELTVGKTITNKLTPGGGPEWLPKTIEQGAPDDSPYINKRYYEMKAEHDRDSNSQMGRRFTALTVLTDEYLKIQTDRTNDVKMWLDFPMFEADTLETVTKDNILKTWAKNIRARFIRTGDDIDQGFIPNRDAEAMINVASADLFDTDINYTLPMSGINYIDVDRVSTDLGMGMLRYLYALEMNQKLLQISPIVYAIQDTVNTPSNGLKEIVKTNAKNKTRTRWVNENTRQKAVNNMIDKVFDGVTLTGVLSDNKTANSLSNAMFGIATTGFFALNIPSALKNQAGAKYQSFINALSGRDFGMTSYGVGSAWSFKTTMEISAQLYKQDVKSLNVQLVEIFDPEKGRSFSSQEPKVGEQISRTFTKDVSNFSWLLNFRKWTQLESTLGIFGGLMDSVSVPQTIGGVTKMIPYLRAWRLVDGQITLKEGIDKEYAPGGKEFKKVVHKMHDLNRRFQGAYSWLEQPEIQRYLLGRWVMLLKKFFTTMFIERWGGKWRGDWKTGNATLVPRYNIATDEMAMGFYIQSIKGVIRAIRNMNARLLWMTEMERTAFLKTAIDVISLIGIHHLIALMFGWDPTEDEKWEKLRQKSGSLPLPFVPDDPAHPFHLGGWLTNHAMSLMLNIKAEQEAWIPLPKIGTQSFGLDDYGRFTSLKSYALGPTLDSYLQVVSDLFDIAWGDETGVYKRDAGPYSWQKAGSYKMWNHIGKSVGITGVNTDPILGTKYALDAQLNPSKN